VTNDRNGHAGSAVVTQHSTLRGEWRTGNGPDVVLIVDEDQDRVREVFLATPGVLSKLLTTPGDFQDQAWRSDLSVDQDRRDPSAWGNLVIARAASGQVITMDPERFWEGVYEWFRSRGVDYDTPGQ
jgi:hypothetical protein